LWYTFSMPRSSIHSVAFTLIEIMIVVSIIGILATVVGINVQGSSAQSRDAQRQADLRNLQTAIEMYRKDNGRYPAGCRGPDMWSGQIGSNVACNPASKDYIIGLAPKYIKALPSDEKLNGTDSGFMYWTNTEGTVYKARAYRTVESETVTFEHPLKPCDIRADLSETLIDREVIGWCARLRETWSPLGSNWQNTGTIRRPHPSLCNPNLDSFNKSYAVWGGFLPKRTNPVDVCGAQVNCQPNVVLDTLFVICR
jgi:prepilin-type N-terminal cleavage/methylation domain-containing protein